MHGKQGTPRLTPDLVHGAALVPALGGGAEVVPEGFIQNGALHDPEQLGVVRAGGEEGPQLPPPRRTGDRF